jgi:hypothetical protein
VLLASKGDDGEGAHSAKRTRDLPAEAAV